jgi:hypothetical protein
MINYHAVMLDETGCEFGHSFRAETRTAAWLYLQENCPESRCVQLEDDDQTREREAAIYARALDEANEGMGDWMDDYSEEE